MIVTVDYFVLKHRNEVKDFDFIFFFGNFLARENRIDDIPDLYYLMRVPCRRQCAYGF